MPGRVRNGVQNRIRIENDESTENKILLIRKPYFLRSRVSKIGPQTGPKLVPNRIFDAEALRKPLESLLERSWRPLEPKKKQLGMALGRLGPKKGAKIGGQNRTLNRSKMPLGAQEAPRGRRGAIFDQF